MGGTPVIFVHPWAGRPCHNASPATRANFTASGGLKSLSAQVPRRTRRSPSLPGGVFPCISEGSMLPFVLFHSVNNPS